MPGKRKRSTIFLERTTAGHRQSDKHWNRFKGNIGDTLLKDRVRVFLRDRWRLF